jgi:hypothetical protein
MSHLSYYLIIMYTLDACCVILRKNYLEINPCNLSTSGVKAIALHGRKLICYKSEYFKAPLWQNPPSIQPDPTQQPPFCILDPTLMATQMP